MSAYILDVLYAIVHSTLRKFALILKHISLGKILSLVAIVFPSEMHWDVFHEKLKISIY